MDTIETFQERKYDVLAHSLVGGGKYGQILNVF